MRACVRGLIFQTAPPPPAATTVVWQPEREKVRFGPQNSRRGGRDNATRARAQNAHTRSHTCTRGHARAHTHKRARAHHTSTRLCALLPCRLCCCTIICAATCRPPRSYRFGGFLFFLFNYFFWPNDNIILRNDVVHPNGWKC